MSLYSLADEPRTGSVNRGRLLAAALAVALLASVLAVFVPTAAHAAPVTDTIDGITYTADDANVAAGATATAYDPAAVGSMGTDPVIPATVTLGGTSYAVTTLGLGSFNNKGLTSVSIPNSVTTIGEGSVAFNPSLTSVVIPNSVTTIGIWAFQSNQLTSVTIPTSVATIGEGAFYNNALTSVTIPNSITTISDNAFRDNALTTVAIPNSVTTIGANAFRENALTSVTIPAAVTTVGEGAFLENPAFASVTFAGDAPVITSAGPTGSFGEAAGKTLYYTQGAGTHAGATPFATPTWEGYNTWISGTVAPVIQTATLPAATAGTAYSQTLTATGTPAPTFAVTAGSLPAGLTLSAAGVISGTPTAQGTASFTITATNVAGTNARQYTITVAAASSSGAKGGALANTGAESNGLFGAAALLLLGAGAVLMTARGLRRAHAQR